MFLFISFNFNVIIVCL